MAAATCPEPGLETPFWEGLTWTQQPLGGSQTLSQRGDDHRDLSHTGALAKPACLDYLVGPLTVLEVGTSIPTLQREKQRP